MATLTSFVGLMLAISVAAERMVEILKGWLPNFWLFKTNPDPAREAQRCAWIHVLSGGCGVLVVRLGHLDVFAGLHGNVQVNPWVSYVGAGLLASGGSAFWNHILDFIKASKIQQEQGAISDVSANLQKSLVIPAHPDSLSLALVSTETTPNPPAEVSKVKQEQEVGV